MNAMVQTHRQWLWQKLNIKEAKFIALFLLSAKIINFILHVILFKFFNGLLETSNDLLVCLLTMILSYTLKFSKCLIIYLIM